MVFKQKRLEDILDPELMAPIYGNLELTYRCDLHCIHCYQKATVSKELDVEKWKDIINQVAELGGLYLNYTGGDPLIYEGFRQVYMHSYGLGFKHSVFTNGFRLDSDFVEFFKKYPPERVEITINSLDPETYEKITGVDGLEKVKENVKNLAASGIQTVIKSNALDLNIKEIDSIKAFSEEVCGKGCYRFDPLIIPTIKGDTSALVHRADIDSIVEVVAKDKEMTLDIMEKQMCKDLPKNRGNQLYTCSGWHREYFIDPYGTLRFCMFSDSFKSDLKDISFREGFDKFRNIPKIKLDAPTQCTGCELNHLCLLCPERARLETGSLTERVDYYCRLSRGFKNVLEDGPDEGS